MARDWRADDRTAGPKYRGKLVEIEGWAVKVTESDPVGGTRLMIADKGARDSAVLDSIIVCTFAPEEAARYQKLEALSEGQSVKIRGVGIDPSQGSNGLVDCEFLEVGPSTAVPCSVAGLFAEFEKSPADGAEKYMRKTLVCRVKIVSVETESIGTRWEVTDPDGDGKRRLPVFITSFARHASRKQEVSGVQPGQVLTVLAKSDSGGTPLRLMNVRILQQPPDGVTLPGGKK